MTTSHSEYKQPKYKFGDCFSWEEVVRLHGQQKRLRFYASITLISCRSTDNGYEYYYTLSNYMPQAYYSPEVILKEIPEYKLTTEYTLETTQ